MADDTIKSIAEVQAQVSGFDNLGSQLLSGAMNLGKSLGGAISSGLESALGGLEKGGGISSALASIGADIGPVAELALGAAGGIVALGAALVGAGMAAEEWDNKVRKLGIELGTTAEQSSLLLGMTGRVGISAEQTATVFGRLERSLQGVETAAESGGKGANALVKELSAMGVATLDVHNHTLPFTEVLGNLADRFHNTASAGERAVLAQKLFGRAGLEMLPFLSQGREGLAALEKQVRATGLVIGDDAVEAAHKFHASMSELNQSFQGVVVSVGNAVLPAMAGVVTGVKDAVGSIRSAFGSVSEVIGDFTSAFSDIHIDFSGILSAVESVLSFGPLKAAIENWGAIRTAVRAFGVELRGASDVAAMVFGDLSNEANRFQGVMRDIGSQAMVPLSQAAGIVGEALGKAMQAGVTAVNALGSAFASVGNFILTAMSSVANTIISNFQRVVKFLQPLLNAAGMGNIGSQMGMLNDVFSDAKVIWNDVGQVAQGASVALNDYGKRIEDAYNRGKTHAEVLLQQRDATKGVTTATSEFAATIPGVVEGVNNVGKAAGKTTSQLQSMIDKLISFTAFKDTGVEPIISKLLGNKDGRLGDAIDETPRRIADVIANGLKSPHMEEIKKTGLFPPELFSKSIGDIQKFFAQWAVEYQKGLHPEALDKGMIEQRVREEIEAEKRKAAFVKSIMADLGAQGLSPTSAQINAAISGTTSGAAGIGTAIGQNLQGELATFNPVGQVADLITSGLTKYGDTLKSAAKAMGSKIGEGVLDGLATQNYGQAIIDKITDSVLAKLSIRKQLTQPGT